MSTQIAPATQGDEANPVHEQVRVPHLDDENAVIAAQDNEDDAAPAAVDGDDGDKGEAEDHPHEKIAAQSRQRRVEELKDTQARVVTDVDPEPAAPAPEMKPDDKIVLKARKRAFEMTREQRDVILAEQHDPDEMADWTEKDRNKYAQMAISDRLYQKEMEEKREALRSTADTKPAQQQPEAANSDTPKAETAAEKRARAIELIQNFGDSAEANRLFAEATDMEVAQRLDAAFNERSQAGRANSYDGEMARIDDSLSKAPGLAENRRAFDVLQLERNNVQREVIQFYIENSPAEMQQTFVNAGWTRETLASMRPHEVAEQYRQLVLHGHSLATPAQLTEVAVKRLAKTNTPGTTPPTQNDTTPSAAGSSEKPVVTVDRSARKEQLAASPERTSVSRQPTRGQPQPKSERARAQAVITEERRMRR